MASNMPSTYIFGLIFKIFCFSQFFRFRFSIKKRFFSFQFSQYNFCNKFTRLTPYPTPGNHDLNSLNLHCLKLPSTSRQLHLFWPNGFEKIFKDFFLEKIDIFLCINLTPIMVPSYPGDYDINKLNIHYLRMPQKLLLFEPYDV